MTIESEAILELRDIQFGYTSNWKLIPSMSFSVKEKDFVGIIGPSGVGKTTIFRIITGFLKPQTGAVFVNKISLSSMKHNERAKYLAVVPQNVNTSMPYKVKQIVEMGRISQLGKFSFFSKVDRECVSHALEYVNIEYLLNRDFSTLSGGEKQRVLIAMAIAQMPKILLLDEPTASLDIALKVYIMDLIKKLNQDLGITVIVISHDVQLAASYCRRMVLINDGKIIADGDTFSVLSNENVSKTYSCNADVFEQFGKLYINVNSK